MFYPVLADQVKYFKETEGGRKIICKAFEDLAEKRAEEKKIEVLLESTKSLMENLKFTAEQAMVALNVSDKDKMILRTRL